MEGAKGNSGFLETEQGGGGGEGGGIRSIQGRGAKQFFLAALQELDFNLRVWKTNAGF